MLPRLVVLAALVSCLVPATAQAHDLRGTDAATQATFGEIGNAGRALAAPPPLTGEGSGMELIANVPIGRAADLELHGNFAFVGSLDEGMVIVDISNPRAPVRLSTFACGGGLQYDVQLDPDLRYALLSIEGRGSSCRRGQEGTIVLDLADLANPREIAFIPIAGDDGAPIGTHTHTLDWPHLYINQFETGYHKTEVFSLENPSQPRRIGVLDFGAGNSGYHDSYVDHRPDGRSLLYAGASGASDVTDVSDPTQPKGLQRVVDRAVTFAHQAEPSFDGDTLLVSDEYRGGAPTTRCGKTADGSPVPGAPAQDSGNPADLGALHLYRLQPDGLIGQKASTFNLPVQDNSPDSGCTVHVFSQAPDQDRLVTAWYGRGVRVVDFADNRAPRELAHFIPTGTYMWAAKPHRGFIYTGDLKRGLDVLRATTPGWPATSGPAEVQRRAQQTRVAARPPATSPALVGPVARRSRGPQGIHLLSVRVRVPGRRGARRLVTLQVLGRTGRVLGAQRFRAAAGATNRLRVRIAGAAGRYRYRVGTVTGRRTLRRGTVTVAARPRTDVRLPAGKRLVVTPRG